MTPRVWGPPRPASGLHSPSLGGSARRHRPHPTPPRGLRLGGAGPSGGEQRADTPCDTPHDAGARGRERRRTLPPTRGRRRRASPSAGAGPQPPPPPPPRPRSPAAASPAGALAAAAAAASAARVAPPAAGGILQRGRGRRSGRRRPQLAARAPSPEPRAAAGSDAWSPFRRRGPPPCSIFTRNAEDDHRGPPPPRQAPSEPPPPSRAQEVSLPQTSRSAGASIPGWCDLRAKDKPEESEG
ncbi:basic salivary proline-rich protein 1-like [Lynx rufus]|uniref:basic salivary proline-rich protein 1-like n=1 Tax=Lynx rufus TaxID=61384 RepID=UPI001F124050|nr:basic salivary proline-rich protein 1-like [Lynx rufus]